MAVEPGVGTKIKTYPWTFIGVNSKPVVPWAYLVITYILIPCAQKINKIGKSFKARHIHQRVNHFIYAFLRA